VLINKGGLYKRLCDLQAFHWFFYICPRKIIFI
jgi:hypothetical protein